MGSNTLVQADIWTVAQTEQGNVVLIRPKESDVAVPIFIGQLETQSILIGLGRVEMPRPLTHDLMLALLVRLGARMARIEISDLREGTYFARLVLETVSGELSLDCRPSDAIALAVRTGADVFIAENIVEETGVPVDMIREAPRADGEAGQADGAVGQNFGIPVEPPGPAGASDPGAPGTEGGNLAAWMKRSRETDERQRLEGELAKAVADEDYELAAAIRDRLKKL